MLDSDTASESSAATVMISIGDAIGRRSERVARRIRDVSRFRLLQLSAGGIALLILDRLGWRIASAIFDRERLITSTK
jgi:hypothetical protein